MQNPIKITLKGNDTTPQIDLIQLPGKGCLYRGALIEQEIRKKIQKEKAMSVFGKVETVVTETLMGLPIVGENSESDASLLKNLDAIGMASWDGGLELLYMGSLEQFIERQQTKGQKEPSVIFETRDKGCFGVYGLKKGAGNCYWVLCGIAHYPGDYQASNPFERGPHIVVKKVSEMSPKN